MLKALFAAFLVLSLSACGQMNPLTLARLATMDPFANDPADIAVELQLPSGVRVPEGGASLGLSARFATTGESFEHSYVLARAGNIYRVAENDLPRLRADIARARAWETEDADASTGSLSVGVAACAEWNGPTPDAVFSIRLSTDGGKTMMPLMTNVPIDRALEAVGDIDAASAATGLDLCK